MNRIHHLLACIVVTLGVLIASGAASSCKDPQTALDAGIVGIRVADDVCKEIEGDAGTLPGWVTLACAIDGAVASGFPKTARVTLPRETWRARSGAAPCIILDGGVRRWDASQGKGGGL